MPSGPLYDFAEVFEDPQVQALGMRVRVPHPKLGEVDLVRNGVRLSDTPVRIERRFAGARRAQSMRYWANKTMANRTTMSGW